MQDAFIHGCQAPPKTITFLRVQGKQTTRIRRASNELEEAAEAFTLGVETPRSAVKMGA